MGEPAKSGATAPRIAHLIDEAVANECGWKQTVIAQVRALSDQPTVILSYDELVMRYEKIRRAIEAATDANDLDADERKFINGLPLEDKVNHQHTRFAEHVADAVVNNRDFPYTTPQGIKADSRDVAIEAISAAFMELWRADVIDPDALVAFLDKEVAQ